MRIAVVGAGPGGIATAVTAAQNGARVTLIDENPLGGGQIWRHSVKKSIPKQAKFWIDKLNQCEVEQLYGYTVYDALENQIHLVDNFGASLSITFDFLIIAVGAKETLLPFPGWTLPNVFGCGGAQSFLKMGMPVKNKNVVVSGSGPLLLAVAKSFHENGALVQLIAEQTPTLELLKFLWALKSQPNKLLQGLEYRIKTASISFQTGSWVKSAQGNSQVKEVTMSNGKQDWNLPCDILACSYGLTPNVELADLLGCEIRNGKVMVDKHRKTSLNSIFAIGECTGIGGVEKALLDGIIAGLYITGKKELLPPYLIKLKKMDHFVEQIESRFTLRKEVLELCHPNTIVCRCEDVNYEELKRFSDQRSAKLYSRMSMGACQGKICSTACHHLFNWESNQVRPPLSPVDLGALIQNKEVIFE